MTRVHRGNTKGVGRHGKFRGSPRRPELFGAQGFPTHHCSDERREVGEPLTKLECLERYEHHPLNALRSVDNQLQACASKLVELGPSPFFSLAHLVHRVQMERTTLVLRMGTSLFN